MKDIRSIVVEKVRSILWLDESEVEDTKDIVNDLGAYSLDIVEIVMGLEQELNVAIPDDEVENIRTVGQLVKYLEGVLA